MPINFRLAPDEIDYILEDAGSVALICDSPAPGVRPVRVVLDVESDYEAALASAAPQREPANVVEDDAALMCYTSGTTGWPNGALLTDRGLVASTLGWIHGMRAGEGRRVAVGSTARAMICAAPTRRECPRNEGPRPASALSLTRIQLAEILSRDSVLPKHWLRRKKRGEGIDAYAAVSALG